MRTALTAEKEKVPSVEKRNKQCSEGTGKKTLETLPIRKNDTNGLPPDFGINSLHILKLHWLTALGISLGIGMTRTDLRFQPKVSQNF